MPTITFSNPAYKDKTVYAVAGSHTETVLKIAKSNSIPIQFDCGDGECGSCIIKISMLGEKPFMGRHLTEKERVVLREVGKVTKDELDRMLVDDIPCEWRLACQMIVRDEDILVEY
ncbi:MAG: 2Fe-2S iron-sulfur cluster-binding protein [Magnetospiraceae bacterium]